MIVQCSCGSRLWKIHPFPFGIYLEGLDFKDPGNVTSFLVEDSENEIIRNVGNTDGIYTVSITHYNL
jgi:hypothetical protein